MTNTLQERLVDLIPSNSLKNAIRETNFQLSDITLLSTAYYCAPDFDSRLEHLSLVRDSLSGEMRAYAERLIQTEHQKHRVFFQDDPTAVIELHIKERPSSYDNTYLCDSVESALQMIPLFYEEYGAEENPSSRHRLVKRRVFSAAPGQAFSEDTLGEAVFLPGRILYSVDVDGYYAESNCSHLCFECDGFSIGCDVVHYPRFTENADAVEFLDNDGIKRFGAVREWADASTNECYVIPLDCPEVREHDLDYIYSHEHIPAPFVEKISPEQLPNNMWAAYSAVVNFILSTS